MIDGPSPAAFGGGNARCGGKGQFIAIEVANGAHDIFLRCQNRQHSLPLRPHAGAQLVKQVGPVGRHKKQTVRLFPRGDAVAQADGNRQAARNGNLGRLLVKVDDPQPVLPGEARQQLGFGQQTLNQQHFTQQPVHPALKDQRMGKIRLRDMPQFDKALPQRPGRSPRRARIREFQREVDHANLPIPSMPKEGGRAWLIVS